MNVLRACLKYLYWTTGVEEFDSFLFSQYNTKNLIIHGESQSSCVPFLNINSRDGAAWLHFYRKCSK